MNVNLTYDDARSNIESILVRGRFAKADVFITNHSGKKYLVKDFTKKGFWERNGIGRFLIGRECRAYAALAGVDGLPAEFKRVSPFALAIEYLDGRDLGGVMQGEIGIEIIRQFEGIMDELHGRGWVHLDLQRRTNILLVEGKVFVVDLASTLHPGGVPLVGRFLTRLLGFFDRLSLIKFKRIYAPDQLTAEEQRWLKLRNFFMPTKW